jgi:formylglycine-generating enzyme required for sulfatase activity
VLKRLILGIFAFAAGVAGNLLAAAIQQDAWQNLFTPERLIATAVGASVMLLILAVLESERGLAWNWPWHRFWYLRGLAANPQIRQWEGDFARLNLAQGKRPFTTTEVIAAGARQDMVTLLHDAFLQKGNHERRMLVLGEPGAGKTTGLERLTLELARRKVWRLGRGRPMPILLRLGNYQSGDLIAFVAAEMGRAVSGHSGVTLSKGLEALLEKGSVLLLCDALDEALGEQRNLVLAELDRFLRSPRYARAGVVITARTREDPGGRLPDLPVYTIQDLHDEAVKAFVRVYHSPGVAEGEIFGRLTKGGLLEPGGLGRNPFWLRIVIESGVFQGEKGKILDQAVNTLLQREWDKPEPERSGWQRVLPRDQQLAESRQALAWLAYQMSVAGLVVVEKTQGLGWLSVALKQQGSPEQLRAAHVVGLGRDAQLLTYLSDKLRFRHRLLQEALTACLLADNGALWAEVINRYADDTAWWDTLLMLIHLVAAPEALIAVILAGGSEQRLFLAAGMLQSVERPSAALRQQVMDALSQSMSQGITEGHKAAVVALAQIMRDDVVVLLIGLFLDGSARLQNGVAQLLAELGDDAVQTALSTLAQSMSQGPTERYKTAAIALAQIMRDDVVALLIGLFLDGNARLQNTIAQILAELGNDAVQSALSTLGQGMGRGITEGHKTAVTALVQIVHEDVVALLRELFWAGKKSQQFDVLALLVSLGGDAIENIFSDLEIPPRRRVEIGRVLAQMGDPRSGVGVIERNGRNLPDIVWSAAIPAGKYTIGDGKGSSDEKTRSVIIHRPYRLARYPITNAQFQCFLEAEDRDNPDWWEGMPDKERQFSEPRWAYVNHPRETVSWYQAMAFCRWLTRNLHDGLQSGGPLTGDLEQYTITLPHEYEWEVAARWPNEDVQEHIYPWGAEFDAAKANTWEGCRVGETTAVGLYPSGKNTALEMYDLSGNVWEWCRNRYSRPRSDLNPERTDMDRDFRVVRGGSWYDSQNFARAGYRFYNFPGYRNYGFGFRVMVVCPPSHLDH